jgi:predicted metal-dependent hydrolase
MKGGSQYSIKWIMDSNRRTLRRGRELFNEGRFYEAHEVLEDVWRDSIGERKQFLQGLVQLAVGFHHYTTDNVIGAKSVLERGISNLAGYPDQCEGINVRALQLHVQAWITALKNSSPCPPYPQI